MAPGLRKTISELGPGADDGDASGLGEFLAAIGPGVMAGLPQAVAMNASVAIEVAMPGTRCNVMLGARGSGCRPWQWNAGRGE